MKYFHRRKHLMQSAPATTHIVVGVLVKSFYEGGSALSDVVKERICPGGATVILLRKLWRQEKVIDKIFDISRVDCGFGG